MRTRFALRPLACLLAGALALAAVTAAAQSPPLRPGTGPADALKMFSETSHDFGAVARGADVKTRITITNPYVEDVHIASVTPSCSCTTVNGPSKTVLHTHESAEIELSMDTRRFVRHKDAVVTVRFDLPQYWEVQIPVQMYVRTDVVLTPGSANFGAVDAGKGATQVIDVAYAGRSDWRIVDAKTTSPHLDVKVEEKARSAGTANYALTVTLKPTAPSGSFRGLIQLVTDDANNPIVPVLAEGRIEAEFVATDVQLGTVTAGQKKTVNAVIRGKKPFAIERIECESQDEAFAVRLTEGEKAVHLLPMTFTAPDKPGRYQEVFTVTIPGRAEPITFKATGNIVAKAAAAAG
jgi:hypothetical protein